jgi:glycosyltransferase involved in cell wall biosynthesis
MLPLTVIITTLNEAQHIGDALASVAHWAAEILVIDAFSSDETLAIVREQQHRLQTAGSTTIRIFERTYHSPADQKNFAIPQAAHEWVLLMDADERSTPNQRAEISHIIETQGEAADDAYWVGFRHYLMGQPVRYSGWQNDYTLRFVRRDRCRYNDKQVHEEIVTDGLRLGKLTHKFEHYTFKSVAHFVAKQARYGIWSAEDHAAKTGRITAFHTIVKPFFRFFKHYILKLGILDGRVGLLISAAAAWSVFLRYMQLSEIRRMQQLK